MATLSSRKSLLLGGKLCDVLGIKGPVTRIVIDIAVRDVAKVYVQRLLNVDEIDSICEALAGADKPEVIEVKDVHVDEKGTVTWVK